MTTTIIHKHFDIGGVLFNPTSCVLRNFTGAYGVRRQDTGAVVVAAGTPMVNLSIGEYEYSFTDPAAGLDYDVAIEFVYAGETYWVTFVETGGVAPAPEPSPILEENVVTSGCGGSYAYAWEFASFWCVSSLLKRSDNSGVNGKVYLQDTQTDFAGVGVEANVGMVLYNLTDGSHGPVTAVTEHTVTASLSGGSDNHWDNGDVYRIVLIDAHEIATIAQVLDIAAGDIQAALAASGACSCTLSSAGKRLVKKINIIEAGAFYTCACAKPSISDDVRQNLLEWANVQLENIRVGKLELCSGATGSEFPSVGWAEQSVNEFAAAQIIENAEERDE